jgi:hypothetical protein
MTRSISSLVNGPSRSSRLSILPIKLVRSKYICEYLVVPSLSLKKSHNRLAFSSCENVSTPASSLRHYGVFVVFSSLVWPTLFFLFIFSRPFVSLKAFPIYLALSFHSSKDKSLNSSKESRKDSMILLFVMSD